VEKHLETKAHEADAQAAERGRARAEELIMNAARAAFICYQEAARHAASFGSRSRHDLDRFRAHLGTMLTNLLEVRVLLLNQRLPDIVSRASSVFYIEEHANGTEETRSFLGFMRDFGLGDLPLTRDLSAVFQDLLFIAHDPKLRSADRRTRAFRSTWTTLSALALGGGFGVPGGVLPSSRASRRPGIATADAITPTGWLFLGNLLVLFLGFIGLWTRATDPLPSRKANIARAEQLIKACADTRIRPGD
jgi:hypothetical protein